MVAFETVVAAVAALSRTDMYKGMAVVELLSLCSDMPDGALPIALTPFRGLFSAFG